MDFWSTLSQAGKAGGFVGSAPMGFQVAQAADQAGKPAWTPGQGYEGMPTAPGYVQGYNPATQASAGTVAGMLGGIRTPTYNRGALDRFSGEAMRTGPSSWARMAAAREDLGRQNAVDHGQANIAGAEASAQGSLARGGGLSSGARERIARQASRDNTTSVQGATNQANLNKAQIGINDEQNRIQQLGMLPGMEAQATGLGLQGAGLDLSKIAQWNSANQADIGHGLADAASQNAYNASNYQTQGQIWGASKAADQQDPRNPASPNFDNGKHWYNPFTWF